MRIEQVSRERNDSVGSPAPNIARQGANAVIQFTIPVQPRTKKNSSQIVMRGKFPLLLPSKQYQQFEKDCLPYLYEVKEQIGVIDYPVNVQAHYYRDSKRRVDIANLHSALHDVLVKSGLFYDDNRDIIAATDGSRVFYDKFNPRIEVMITEITDYVQWNDTKNKQITLLERKQYEKTKNN